MLEEKIKRIVFSKEEKQIVKGKLITKTDVIGAVIINEDGTLEIRTKDNTVQVSLFNKDNEEIGRK